MNRAMRRKSANEQIDLLKSKISRQEKFAGDFEKQIEAFKERVAEKAFNHVKKELQSLRTEIQEVLEASKKIPDDLASTFSKDFDAETFETLSRIYVFYEVMNPCMEILDNVTYQDFIQFCKPSGVSHDT